MSSLFVLKTGSAPLAAANALADALGEFIDLEPQAVCVVETDEAAALWTVEAYYADRPALARLTGAFDAAGLSADAVTIEAVETRDWVAETLSALAPVRAGRFFVHGAHDRAKRPPGGISIELPAANAFGTGHHGTTRGCLMALDKVLKFSQPMRILDVGCGSGLLAIAGALATRRPVVASDIDPLAVRVTRNNAVLNGVGTLIGATLADGPGHRTIVAGAPFDLVFANILAGPLRAMATGLIAVTRPGGRIILSGLLNHQEVSLLAAYRARGAVLAGRIQLEGWSTLTLLAP